MVWILSHYHVWGVPLLLIACFGVGRVKNAKKLAAVSAELAKIEADVTHNVVMVKVEEVISRIKKLL